MAWQHVTALGFLAVLACWQAASGQAYCPPDRGKPGDEMIQAYLARQAAQIHDRFLRGVKSPEDWKKLRAGYVREYLHMLGLEPMPPQTPLKATVTGTLTGDGYVVDMLHYQSRPRLYVTGNLYRPAKVEPGRRLPAVFYVCGHSYCGRNGNKTAYQSHGIWFARHGYVCLVVDSLQLGEIAATHHGTYREKRWWWHSRGYTPAGVECLNGMRGIDYLVSRGDVDPERIAVTGISGGGAASFWIAAADERVRVAVPVSGMADLPSYVTNRVINGHCDCMFLYNTFRWPWTRIAALVAPRALLFTNSDRDPIFPMDANRRVISRLEDLYKLYGAGDRVDACVSSGGHAYRKDIRQAAYRFINTYLKNDPREVTDSEVDLVVRSGGKRRGSIEPKKLRVFPEDGDLPADELNTTIDRHFVPQAKVPVPAKEGFGAWKKALLAELGRVTFGSLGERIPPARRVKEAGPGLWLLETAEGIRVPLRALDVPKPAGAAKRIVLLVAAGGPPKAPPGWLKRTGQAGDLVYVLVPRGFGPTRWTRKNPPNTVERSCVLLGRTVDTGRVWDIAAAARYLRAEQGPKLPVHLAGEGAAGVLAACAALWEPDVAGAILRRTPMDFMLDEAPQFLNVLRVGNVPDLLGLLAPRPLMLHGRWQLIWGGFPHGPADKATKKLAAIYAAAGKGAKFVHHVE